MMRNWNSLGVVTLGLAVLLAVGAAGAKCGPSSAGQLKLPNAAQTGSVTVSDVENRCEELPAGDFWQLVTQHSPASTGQAGDPWQSPALRLYALSNAYFVPQNGRSLPRKVYEANRTLPGGAKSFRSVQRGLGAAAADTAPVLATDLPGSPPMEEDARYNKKYFPRQLGNYLVDSRDAASLGSAYALTGHAAYASRSQDLLGFLLYEQYMDDGSNRFVNEHINAGHRQPAWKYGFPILDWDWQDSFGYKYEPQETDHHVAALYATALVKGYEEQQASDSAQAQQYLQAATNFVYYQVPRFGFHTGLMTASDGSQHRYYWTEYNPSGGANESRDAVDNVQALVAQAAAGVGYDARRPALLAYANGLLWYLVREFKADGRFYYFGAEAPFTDAKRRLTASHDAVVLSSALPALAYLVRAGVAEPQLQREWETIMTAYLRNDDLRNAAGISADFKYAHAWRAQTGTGALAAGQATAMDEYFLITDNANRVSDLELSSPLSAGSKTTLSRWEPSGSGMAWRELASWTGKVKVALKGGGKGVYPAFQAQPGDLYRLAYSWKVDDPARFNPDCGPGSTCNKDRFRVLITTPDAPKPVERGQDAIVTKYPDVADAKGNRFALSQLPALKIDAANWLDLIGRMYL